MERKEDEERQVKEMKEGKRETGNVATEEEGALAP